MKIFFKRCLFLLDSKAKKELPILFLIFFSSSFLDVVGIGLVGAFLLLIVNFTKMVHKLPLSLQNTINHYSKNEVIFFIGVVLVFAFVFKAVWGIYSQKRIVLFTSQFAARLKMRLMVGYQNAVYSFHLKQNAAYLINKVGLADSFSNNVLSTSLNMLSSFLVVLGVIACLLVAHPIVTFFLTVMIGLIFILYEVFVKSKVIKMGKIMAISGGEINKSILQALGGLKEVRVLGKESFFLNKIKGVAQGYSGALSTYNSLQLIPRYAVESAASIFLVTLVLGALMVGTSPLEMIPTLGIFAAACIRLLPTISQLIGQFSQLRSAGYATTLFYDELNAVESQYKINLFSLNAQESQSFSAFSLRGVSFNYVDAKYNALTDIHLTILRGQSVGFIGTSGAGKSTLVSIILGLLPPSNGNLLIDGQPINHLRAWLNNFAYIPQAIFLLDDTLKRNIAMGSSDDEIDDHKLNQAIEMAQLAGVVSDLPEGVDTLIGENGVRLSGGQRQRVALARAFYYEREIIIMDEATSSLDNETEYEVINAIKKLHGVKTLIVIAHRLSTIQYCDVIYKLEKGRIVAQGTFDEVVGNDQFISAAMKIGNVHE
ncbi:MAG: ABC transporter ATP-binding protein [Gammaproteobacteria bacterium CG_4_10_14_0_8_um_filter_38_16]|nr:MAG: ABC transporter ATP-binding protein [Gammaproteobacteria bacterium CG_4_10_14_0_8_um_filter_38_16]PJA04117.1 MAG: ABC transporter ATP-binding protein [Gammaproteobacteria bacterium CG_4_10_14_0_2_um_filter_38_22]PJB10017.1 MAG: ABC transporter ATP-binding protein [Gammaproteobacteria bacterium CG_4_9_14_3_um_filter_38_9]